MENLTSFVVNVINNDGTPKIDRKMTEKEWATYQSNMAALRETLKESCKSNCSGINVSLCRQITVPLQTKQKHASIAYHAPGGNSYKTIGTSGNFPITTQAILKFFGKKVPLEDLIQIALQGDWISKEGGTYWHYIDAVCVAYGLCVARISSFEQILATMQRKGLVAALFKHDLFPKGLGAHLGIITKVDGDHVFMRSPSKSCQERVSVKDFCDNLLTMWTIVE